MGRAAAAVGVQEGRLRAARTYRFNPELSAALSPVRAGGLTLFDFEVSLSQVIELGGKRGRRVEIADAQLAASRARAQWTGRQIVLRVRRAYYLAAIDRAVVRAAGRAVTAADAAKAATVERLRLKVGTQLEVNVAAANAGRARHTLLDAKRAYIAARADLAAAIGAPPDQDFEPVDGATAPLPPAISEDALVAAALVARADLHAARLNRDAAAAGVALADAKAVPDIAVSLSYARERDPDLTFHIFSAGVAIPLPIFQRNQGERAAARSALRLAKIDERAARWQAERNLRAAYRGYHEARAAVHAFDLEVVSKLDENLALARESFEAGKIGILELNVVQRNLVDTQLAYLEARRDAIEAMIALQAGAGKVEVFR